MGAINIGAPANSLEAARTQLLGVYQDRFIATESQVGDLVQVQPVTTRAFIHAFITSHPVMRRWRGERVSKSFRFESIAGEVDHWEQTGDIEMRDVLSSYLAPYLQDISNFGYNAKRHPDAVLAERLNNGTSVDTLVGATTTANYDGVALFAATHKTDDGANNGTNNYTSNALTKANLHTSIENMMAVNFPNGQPMNLRPTHLIVPTALYMNAVELCRADLLGVTGEGSVSNVVKSVIGLQPLCLPELNNTTTWFLADASRGPIAMRYVLKDTYPTYLLDPTDPNVFFEDKYVYGTNTYDELLMGPWQFVQRNIA